MTKKQLWSSINVYYTIKMSCYLTEPRDWIFVKAYVLLYLIKNVNKTIGNNISKKVSGKYGPGMLAAR